MEKFGWWRSTEFGSKSNRLPDFIFDTVLYGIVFFFSKFQAIAIEKRLLFSLLVGMTAALVAGFARYLLKPSVDKWKASIKKRRVEKRESLNNLG
jgi:hypothetical protein